MVVWVHEWTQKVHQYTGPFTHILLGLRTDQHLTRFNRWEGPVWAQSARAYFKLYECVYLYTAHITYCLKAVYNSIYSGDTFWLFIKLFREHFGVSIIWLRDLTFLQQACFRSYVSFEPSSTKQSACAQNPTSYRGWFQPGARLCIINIISRPLELRLLNWKESVILIKMVRVYMVDVNETNTETFPLREARSASKWNKIITKRYSVLYCL